MPAVSKAQQRFMGMVHAAQKSEDPSPFSKDVKKAADSMSKKSAKDFASTKHKGLPDHVKEGSVTDKPEEPTKDDLDDMPSPVAAVSVEGITTTSTTHSPSLPTPTNNILWTATGKVCEGRPMVERIKMYEKKGGGWRMGKQRDEQVYNNLKEFYKNEIQPRKEAKELIVKRRMGEAYYAGPKMGDVKLFDPVAKDYINALVKYQDLADRQQDISKKYFSAKTDDAKKDAILQLKSNQRMLSTAKDLLDRLETKYEKGLERLMVGEGILREDDMAEPGGDVVSKSGVQDHEVSMARASLLSMSRAIQDLMGKLGTGEKNLPGWVQDHITNAENYIVQAAKGYQDSSKEELGNNIQKPENTNYAPAQNGK